MINNIILLLKSVHVRFVLVIFLRVFACKVTIDNVWGKFIKESLTQVATNTRLVLKERDGLSGYKVILSESIANIINSNVIKGCCEREQT